MLDDQGSVYTWGFGAYGRLGHKTPKDEWKPRKVDFFSNRMAVPPGSLITAGGAFSGCTAGASFTGFVFPPFLSVRSSSPEFVALATSVRVFCLFFDFRVLRPSKSLRSELRSVSSSRLPLYSEEASVLSSELVRKHTADYSCWTLGVLLLALHRLCASERASLLRLV